MTSKKPRAPQELGEPIYCLCFSLSYSAVPTPYSCLAWTHISFLYVFFLFSLLDLGVQGKSEYYSGFLFLVYILLVFLECRNHEEGKRKADFCFSQTF